MAQMIHPAHLKKLLQWLEDLESGEMIEVPRESYTKSYLGFNQISQQELDELCNFVNDKLAVKPRICNGMGEIYPLRQEFWR